MESYGVFMSIWAYSLLNQDVMVHRNVILFLKTVDRACVNLGCFTGWFVPSHMNVKSRFNRSWFM